MEDRLLHRSSAGLASLAQSATQKEFLGNIRYHCRAIAPQNRDPQGDGHDPLPLLGSDNPGQTLEQ